MKRVDEIRALSAVLQADVRALNGKAEGPVPELRTRHLLPLGLLAGMALLFAVLPPAKRYALLRLALASAQALHTLAAPPRR